VWTEALVLFAAAAGALFVFRGKYPSGTDPAFARFIAVYTLAATVIYSAIPYKTPWCMLTFLHGMTLLGGIGLVALIRSVKPRLPRICVALALTAAAVHLGWQAYRAAYRFPADPRNPYVYAHTSERFLDLVKRVEQIAAVHPRDRDMLIHVVASPQDTWPLPWYLRSFRNVGYWTAAGEAPAGTEAAIVITSTEFEEPVGNALGDGYVTEYHQLRPDVLLAIHVREDAWSRFLETRQGTGG
jgi:predicted membrane-bound mannosyltransferase